MLKISLFEPGAQAHETRFVSEVREVMTLDELLNEITTKPWSAGIFKDGVRANKNLESIELLVLDIDEGCTLEEARQQFADYKHIIATTRSHQKEKNGITCDRFRVILFLHAPATSDQEYKEYWHAAQATFPFIDPACKDSARFFYPCSGLFNINYTGRPWHHKKLNQSFAKPIHIHSEQVASGQRGKLARATLEFIAQGAPEGQWHHQLYKAAIDFKQQGYTYEEARERLLKTTGVLDDHDEMTINDVYENRAPRHGPREAWIEWPVLRKNKQGEMEPHFGHPDNYLHFLGLQGYKLSMNQLDGFYYLNDKQLTDQDYSKIYLECVRVGLSRGKDFLMDVLHTEAQRNSFNPFRQAIEVTSWDGKDHISELFNQLTVIGDKGEQAEAYDYFKKWLVGVVAKVYRPGAQNFVLTFVGDQGIGKSRFLAKLALVDGVFGEGAVDPGNKDHELRHLSHIIWHIPELEYTTGKREAGALKDYLTKDVVTVRPAYARTVRVGRSVCSFCASVNSDAFLVDQTGNRRFVIIELSAINPDHSVNIQQVYAQAKALLETGFVYWFTKEEALRLNERNLNFEEETELKHLLNGIKPGEALKTGTELLKMLGIQNPTKGQLKEVGLLFKRMGIPVRRLQLNRGRTRYYLVDLQSILATLALKSNIDN